MKNIFIYTLAGEQFAAAIRYRNQHLIARIRVRRLMQFVGSVAWIAMVVALFTVHERDGVSVVQISLT